MDIRISQCSSVNRLLYCPGESILSYDSRGRKRSHSRSWKKKKKKAKQKQDSRLNKENIE